MSQVVGGDGRSAAHGRAGGSGISEPARRLRAITDLTKALASAYRFPDVARLAAEHARVALAADVAALSRWERSSGRLRVLINAGELAAGEEPLPEDETYLVSDFPEIMAADRPVTAWVRSVDDPQVDPARAELLRRRGRASCLVAPIVLDGRAWGELYVARGPDAPRYSAADVDFGAAIAALVAAGLAQAEHFERIERLAFTDPLTGLANRRALDVRLDEAIDAHVRSGAVVSLIVCDVNGLKRLNDEQGHDVGDRLLVQVAGVLSAAGSRLPGSLAARLGGDEFCVLVEGHSADDAVRVAEDLCLRGHRLPGGDGLACGVASTGDPVGPVTTGNRLFRLADAAQYRAKRSRAPHPVVAGRGQPPDPTIRLAARATGNHVGAEHPDRRRFRGATKVEADRLLTDVLAALDAAADVAARPPEPPDRLEVVADHVARAVDAAAWRVSFVAADARGLRAVRYALYRTTGHARQGAEPGASELDLDRHPTIAAAVRGGGYACAVGQLGADPATEALLTAAGYSGVLAAGGAGAAGGWLVEILTDEISLPVLGLEPTLRALVAVALIAPPAPPATSVRDVRAPAHG